ncbi:MAG: glycine cleavage system aminomethyltransferase GcvT [Bacteroidales bacterium]
MKKTVFHPYHLERGGRMVPFAGYEMPVEYTGIKREHNQVRQHAGVFDVSHMGEIWVRGPRAFSLVQRLTSNDAAVLKPGDVQYSCLPNETGGIVDDLLVYCQDSENYLLVVNASNIEKDHDWILSHNRENAEVDNASDRIAQLAVQGPKAASILQKLTEVDLSAIPYYHFVTGSMAGIDGVILSNTGYTGAGGFELYVDRDRGGQLWEALFAAAPEEHLLPVGLGARDTLRLEMGYCLYGNDIDDSTSPLEAGLGWITKFTEKRLHQPAHAGSTEKSEGPIRRLVGFEMTERGIPRQHYPILGSDGQAIGEVTSGTQSPYLDKGIGMGYVAAGLAKPGTEIRIEIRNKPVGARIVRPPFVRKEASWAIQQGRIARNGKEESGGVQHTHTIWLL